MADPVRQDMIDPKTQEIKPADDETYSNMLDLADELPDSSPRFVLLSYPLTLVSAPTFSLLAPPLVHSLFAKFEF
jgi:hypothetical protein